MTVMRDVGQREIRTRRRVVAFFQDALGYACLGRWQDREGNSNLEEALLTDWLKQQGHDGKIIGKILHESGRAAALGGSKTLYDANREVYGLLRYGVKVKPEIGGQNITVWLIDWENPDNNDFAVVYGRTLFNSARPAPEFRRGSALVPVCMRMLAVGLEVPSFLPNFEKMPKIFYSQCVHIRMILIICSCS